MECENFIEKLETPDAPEGAVSRKLLRTRAHIFLFAAILVFMSMGCKRGNPRDNLLVNSGFEEGRTGWFWMDWSKHWVDFETSENRARSGKKSAYLRLDVQGPSTREVEIHGVVQELKPAMFPEVARGWYRVENWERGSPKQYLQFVVIVWGGHSQFKNYQIRYILAGVASPPHRMKNAKYLFAPNVKQTPTQNEWVSFEVRLLDQFRKQWGMVPAGYEKINFFFEARYDTAPPEGKKIRADIYFDDLYVGGGS